MKYIKLIPLLVFIVLASCRLGPDKTFYSNVAVPIDQRDIPRTVDPGEPFSIYAHVTLDNACWSNIRFFFDTVNLENFQLYALADFKDEGVCPEIIVSGDTIINLTASELPGDYVIRVWMNTYEFELDTVTVTEVIK